MLVMNIMTWEPDKRDEVLKRTQMGVRVPEGVKMLGLWSDVSGCRAFFLIDATDKAAVDPKAILEGWWRPWGDLCKLERCWVIETEELMKLLPKG